MQESPSYIEAAVHYMEDNYQKDISLEFLAERLHLNPRYFSTLFKRKKGITPIDYLTDIRIGKAKKLLLQEEFPASEIAPLVGYHDPRYFYKVFKKRTGLPPAEWRVQNQIPPPQTAEHQT